MSKERIKMDRIVPSCRNESTVIIVERFPNYYSTFQDLIWMDTFMQRNNNKMRNLMQFDQLILTLLIFKKATALIKISFNYFTHIPYAFSNFCELCMHHS